MRSESDLCICNTAVLCAALSSFDFRRSTTPNLGARSRVETGDHMNADARLERTEPWYGGAQDEPRIILHPVDGRLATS